MKLLNPVEGIITSSFGRRQSPALDDVTELHTGIDIAVAKGSGVVAVDDGVVTEVRYSETYGNVLMYKISGDIEIMYAHLDTVLVEQGSSVKRGDIVARSGNTGLSTGAHLHYTMYKNSELIDPMPYVSLQVSSDVEQEYIYRGERLYSEK